MWEQGPPPGRWGHACVKPAITKGSHLPWGSPPGKAEGQKERGLLADRQESISARTDSHVPAPGTTDKMLGLP